MDYNKEILDALESSNREIAERNQELSARIAALEVAESKANRPNFSGSGDDQAAASGDLKTMRGVAQIKSFYSAKAQAAEEDPALTLADFARGAANMKTSPAAVKALSGGTSSAGGFAVPNLVQSQIMQALVPVSSLLRAGAGLVALEAGTQTTFAAVSSIPTAAWRDEAGSIAESDPAFRAVVATPHSLSFFFKVSRELLADGRGIDEALTTAIAQAFAKELDRAGLRGSGVSPEPKGLLNTSGLRAVLNGVNGAAITNYGNLLSAAEGILQADGPMPTSAIMSPRSLVKFGALQDTIGQPMSKPDLLKGMTLIGTSQVPNNLIVGSSTDTSEIYVGDFTQVAYAMRENVSIMQTDQVFATSGQIGFVCHARVDVIVRYPSAFALVTGVR